MPTGRQAHLDRPLTNLTVKAFDGGASNIADAIAPVIPVDKRSDKYYTFTKSAWLRVPNTRRGPAAPSPRVTWEISSDSYYAEGYGLAAEWPVEDAANADASLRFRESTAMQVAEKLARDREVRMANIISSGGNVGSGATISGTNQWSDYVNSDPIGQVNTGHAYIEQNTGLQANLAIATPDIVRIARSHPDVIRQVGGTTGRALNLAQLADAFGVERILLGRGIKENALEGGTSSITNIWPNNFILAHFAPAAGLMTRTTIAQFRWTNPELGQPFAAQRHRNDEAGSNHTEVVEVRYYQDEKVIAPETAYVLASVI